MSTTDTLMREWARLCTAHDAEGILSLFVEDLLYLRRAGPGTCRGSGKTFKVPGCCVMKFSNNRIEHHKDYWNLLTFNQQIGAAP